MSVAFEKVTSLQDLWSGELTGARVGNKSILLVNIGGEVFAYENRCVHQAALLSEGSLQGHVLTCRLHEWQYDARSGGGINPARIQLERYAVEIREDDVFVDVHQVVTEHRGLSGGCVG